MDTATSAAEFAAARPAPPPPVPEPSVAEKARTSIAQAKVGEEHVTRPFHYAMAFVGGTIKGGLDGLARWGRFGLKWGGITGLVVGVATGALAAGTMIPILVTFGGGALLASGALGAVHGLATGGMRAYGRERRRDLYADDLIVRDKIQKTAPVNRSDYRAALRSNQRSQGVIAQQVMEREAERRQDENTYWQDREHRTGNGWSNSRW